MEKKSKTKTNTRRHAKPAVSMLLDDREFARTLQKTRQLLRLTEDQVKRKEKIPKDSDGGGRSQRMAKILKTPRLGDLPTRRKLLAAKCRAAGAKSPSHLYLLQSA